MVTRIATWYWNEIYDGVVTLERVTQCLYPIVIPEGHELVITNHGSNLVTVGFRTPAVAEKGA